VAEVLFYHLEQRPLEQVLPVLLEKTLERGWRAVVEVGSEERLQSLDSVLWTYRDESFLPHAPAGSDGDARQPVILTTATDNPNGAEVRFFAGGAMPASTEGYQRIVLLFDGHDPDALAAARDAWRKLRPGNEVTYWQQDADGRWARKA